MAEVPNRIPLRRFFTAGELGSNESVAQVRKFVESGERHENEKNFTKALKYYKQALETLQSLVNDASASLATEIRQISTEIQDKIYDLEDLQATRSRSSSMSGVVPTRPRRDSTIALPDTTRSRSNTQTGPDGPSSSSAAATSTTKSSAKRSTGSTSSAAPTKEPREGRVRFVEQKKVYFYTDVTPPTETLSIINGFVTALGLPEEEFEPLYRDCVHCVEYPLHGKMPESPRQMLQMVLTAFCLSKEEQDNIMDSQAYGVKHLVRELRDQLRRVRRNPFYAANTFKDDEDFEKWVESEIARVQRQIHALRKLVSKSSPAEKQEFSEAEREEDAFDRDLAARRKQTHKLQRNRKLSEVREEPNLDGDDDDENGKSSDSRDPDHGASDDQDFEEEDPENPGLERSPLRYDLLFRLLVSRDYSGSKAAEQRLSRLKPCFSKLEEWLAKTPVRDNVDIDAEFFAKSESNLKHAETLFILTKPSRWLLDEYAERYGFTPLYRLLVVLSWVVSTLSTDADKLLMLHIMLQRAMNIFKQEEYVYNKKELLFFLRIMKELNREVEHYIFNVFRYFDHTRLLNLRLLCKLVVLMFECNEFVGLSDPVRYDDFMRTAIEKSIKNHYRDILNETEEPKDPQAGDPIGTNTSLAVRKRRERSLTADQLIEAFSRVAYHLDHVDKLGAVFPGLGSLKLSDLCADVYLKDLFSDVKLFAIKFAQNQSTTRVLVLALQIREINATYVAGRENIDELPVEHLFGSFVEKWLEETETIFKTWVTSACKQESWHPMDPRGKKLWSQSAEDLYRMCADPLPFVRQNEVMLVNIDDGEPLSPTANDSLVKQYSKMIGRILKEYVEHLYNLFVDEFPEEVHSDLHDLYIQDFFENITRTGGAGALQISYEKRKRSIGNLFRRDKSSASVDLSGSLAAVGRFSTLRGTPKLGKSNAVSEGLRQRTMTIGGGRTNNTLGGTPSSASLATLNSREAKEYGIRVWNKIQFTPDKVKKLKKSRKSIALTARMCIKVNDVETVRVLFEHFSRHEKDMENTLETSFIVMKKVYHIFINMIIYVCNLYMEAEIEYMFAQSKKKPTKEAVASVYSFCTYLQHQLLVLHANLKMNIFRRVLLRIWKVVLEDIIDIIIPANGQSVPSLAQICVLEDLMDGIKTFFSKYGMSSTHLTQKIQEMHQLARKHANADDLANTRVLYIEQKDKFEKKRFVPSNKGLKTSKSSLIVSESSESQLLESDQPHSHAHGHSHSPPAEVAPSSGTGVIVESSIDSNELSSSTNESNDDDSSNPPFPKIVPQRREPRRGALSGGIETDEIIGANNQANAGGIIEKEDDEDPNKLSRQSSGQGEALGLPAQGPSDNIAGAKSAASKRNLMPGGPRPMNIAGSVPPIDTDDMNGGQSETDNILQRRGQKGRYYDETEREETATELDTEDDDDAAPSGKRGVRRPVMLKIVAGGADARAARRRQNQDQNSGSPSQTHNVTSGTAAVENAANSKDATADAASGQPLTEEELHRRLEAKLKRLEQQQNNSANQPKASPPIAVMALTSDDGTSDSSDSSSGLANGSHGSRSPPGFSAHSPRSDNDIDSALKAMAQEERNAAKQAQAEQQEKPAAPAAPEQAPAPSVAPPTEAGPTSEEADSHSEAQSQAQAPAQAATAASPVTASTGAKKTKKGKKASSKSSGTTSDGSKAAKKTGKGKKSGTKKTKKSTTTESGAPVKAKKSSSGTKTGGSKKKLTSPPASNSAPVAATAAPTANTASPRASPVPAVASASNSKRGSATRKPVTKPTIVPVEDDSSDSSDASASPISRALTSGSINRPMKKKANAGSSSSSSSSSSDSDSETSTSEQRRHVKAADASSSTHSSSESDSDEPVQRMVAPRRPASKAPLGKNVAAYSSESDSDSTDESSSD